MLSEKNKSALRSYENRLENEDNDPELIPLEECSGYGRCDKLTEPKPDTDTCSECGLEYGQGGNETVEALQNRIAELERWHKNNVRQIGELIHETDEVLGPKIAELEATIIGYRTMYPPKK